MAKSSRPSAAKTPSSRTSKAKPVQEQEENLPVENKKKSSSRISSKKSSSSKSSSAKAKPSQKFDRGVVLERRQNATNKRIIIAAVVVVLGLVGFMFGGNMIDDSRVDGVRNISVNDEKVLLNYFKMEAIISVGNSRQAAIRKINKMIEAEIASNGPVVVKNNLIAGLAYTYYINPNISNTIDSLNLLRDITKKDVVSNRNFAIQALTYIPGGAQELETIIRSKDADTESSLLALKSLPNSGTGKISGDVLVYALEKEDPEFLKKVFPLVNENVEIFKEQPNAVKVLLKNSGNTDESISKSSIELLSKCIFKPEHYSILKNNVLGSNKKVSDNALTALLGIPTERSGGALSDVLVLSKDSSVKLKVLERLGSPECSSFYASILPALKDNDKEIVKAALGAIGKLKNTPEKGLKEVIICLSNDNPEIKLAAIIATKGFEYRKPFYYAESPDQMPSFSLIKLVDSPDENIKAEVIKSLEKLNETKLLSANEWKDWFSKEKGVLDLLIEMERKHKAVQEKIKKALYKEAKVEFKSMEQILNTLSSDHINQWKTFDKFLEKKGNDYNLMKIIVNKHAPID